MAGMILAAVLIMLVGGFSLLCWVGAGREAGWSRGGKYDERQRLAQGRGFMWGFIAVCVFGAAALVSKAVTDRELLPASEALIMSVCIGAAVIANYCVAHDAYIPVGGRGIAEMICTGLYALTALIRGLDRLEEQGPAADGALGRCWVWFCMFLACASVFLSLLIKMLLGRRNRE